MAILQPDGVNNVTDLILKRNSTEGLRLTNTGTVQLSSVNDGPLAGNRNRVINGLMEVNQRLIAPFTVPVFNEYVLDRWRVASTFGSNMQISVAVDGPGPGFVVSQKATALLGTSLEVNDYNVIFQSIEGFNVSDFGFGTADAITATLSFYVKSSLFGTFGGSLRNGSNTRSRPFTYSIPFANTWTYVTYTFPCDTSGTWLKTNGNGLQIMFDLGTGDTFRGTPNVWATANYTGAAYAVSPMATLGATWQVTGVQLERGSVATPFERRPTPVEVSLCKRYAQYVPYNLLFYAYNDSEFLESTVTYTEMRTIPSVSALEADPYLPGQQANVNTDANHTGFSRPTTYGSSISLGAIATGYSYVIGNRALFSAEL